MGSPSKATRERAHQAMRDAAKALRNGRWLQNQWVAEPHRPEDKQQYGYCVVGALRHAVSGSTAPEVLNHPLPREQEEIVRAAALELKPIIGADPYQRSAVNNAVHWNDTKAKNGDEVIAALEKGAGDAPSTE